MSRVHSSRGTIIEPMPRKPDETSQEYIQRVLRATGDVIDQMERRSDPLYELSKANSRRSSEAWRAAGSPRKPKRSGIQRSTRGVWERVDTPEWRAWRSWLQQRDRLRRQHGMAGSGGIHYGRPPFRA